MHENVDVRKQLAATGFDLSGYDQVAEYLKYGYTPVNYPKPSGTKERRKIERQRKKLARQQQRKRK